MSPNSQYTTTADSSPPSIISELKMMNISSSEDITKPIMIDNDPEKEETASEPSPEQVESDDNDGGDANEADVDAEFAAFLNRVHSSEEIPPPTAAVMPVEKDPQDIDKEEEEEEEPTTAAASDDAYIGEVNSSEPATANLTEEEIPLPVHYSTMGNACIPAAAIVSGEDVDGSEAPSSPSKPNEDKSVDLAQDEATNSPSKAAGAAAEEGGAGGGAITAISLDVGELRIADDLPEAEEKLPERRSSSEHRMMLDSTKLSDSAATVDSWGGNGGTVPPLLGDRIGSMPELDSELLKEEADIIPSGVENDGNDDSNNAGGESPPSAQDPTKSAMASTNKSGSCGDVNDMEDVDEPASYINFNKLLDPSASSKYYYSQANASNRKLIEKVKTKKPSATSGLDESRHSRKSIMGQLTTSSAYRGRSPTKKDGSVINSAMKRTARKTSSSSNALSQDSLASQREVGDENSNNSGPKPGHVRRCTFSCVDIREHERVAGDNPCVSSGVPISLGWGYYQNDPISLDDYEYNKGPSRDKIEMMVPAKVRRQMLRDEFGVTITDMNAAMKEVNITKRQRRNTVATEHLEGWQEATQSAKRKLKRFMKRTSTVKEQEKMWDEAHKNAVKNGKGNLVKSSEGPKGAGPMASGQVAAAPLMEISFKTKGGEQQDEAPTF